MQKQLIYTKNAPEPVGPYSQAVRVGNMLFCSGQIAINPSTNELEVDDIVTETHRVLKNLGEVLKAAGVDYGAVVKTGIFLADMSDFAAMNEVYAQYFSEAPPARACVAVKTLPKNVNVEIEAIAII